MKITPFNGNPMNWNLWVGLFKTLIDSKPLHDAEKMSHQQTLTVGRAIKHFAVFCVTVRCLVVNNLVEGFRHVGFENALNSKFYTQIAADKLSLNDRLRWNDYIVQNQITHVTVRFQSMVSSVSTSLQSDSKCRAIHPP